MRGKKETARPRGTDSARVIQVIQTMASVGKGTAMDPKRVVLEVWTLEGELIAVNDPYAIYPGTPSFRPQER